MKRLLVSLVALVLAAIPANAQTTPGQFPSNTFYCNPAGSAALASPCSVAQLLALLAANNNLASPLYMFNANVITSPTSPSSPAYQFKFGPPLWQAITDSNRTAIVGQSVQNTNPSLTPAILPALIGYGVLTTAGAGNQVQGMFARGECQAAGGCTGIEIDAWNTSSADAPDSYPAVDAYGTTSVWTFGTKIAAAGTKINWAGIHFVQEPTAPGNSQFRAGIYATPAIFQHYGIFLDADATHSPITSMFLRNTGLSSNIHLLLQTMGTPVLTNPVIQHENSTGLATFIVTQSGQVVANANAAAQAPRSAGFMFTGVAIDGSPTAIGLDAYSNTTGAQITASAVVLRSANGSGASPSALAAGSIMGVIAATPYVTGGFLGFSPARVLFNYTDPTPADGGAEIEFDVTPNGSTVVGSRIVAGKFLNNGTLNLPQTVTGTPAASLCIDASNNIIKKTTTGPCV